MAKTTFSSNLRRAITFNEMTLEQAARACSVKKQTIEDLLDGLAEPGLSLLLKLADGLGAQDIRAFISDPHFLTTPGSALKDPKEDEKIRALERSIDLVIDELMLVRGLKQKLRGSYKGQELRINAPVINLSNEPKKEKAL